MGGGVESMLSQLRANDRQNGETLCGVCAELRKEWEGGVNCSKGSVGGVSKGSFGEGRSHDQW